MRRLLYDAPVFVTALSLSFIVKPFWLGLLAMAAVYGVNMLGFHEGISRWSRP